MSDSPPPPRATPVPASPYNENNFFRSDRVIVAQILYRPEVFSNLYWTAYGLIIGGVVTAIFLIGIPVIFAGLVCWYILMYKCWKQISDGYQRTTPGLAVGLCFVPFFNLYWIFVANWGLGKDINAYIRRHNVQTQFVSEGLGLAATILFVCAAIPYIGLLISIPALIVGMVFYGQVKSASSRIALAKINGEIPPHSIAPSA